MAGVVGEPKAKLEELVGGLEARLIDTNRRHCSGMIIV
jgi:hypothetical protein